MLDIDKYFYHNPTLLYTKMQVLNCSFKICALCRLWGPIEEDQDVMKQEEKKWLKKIIKFLCSKYNEKQKDFSNEAITGQFYFKNKYQTAYKKLYMIISISNGFIQHLVKVMKGGPLQFFQGAVCEKFRFSTFRFRHFSHFLKGNMIFSPRLFFIPRKAHPRRVCGSSDESGGGPLHFFQGVEIEKFPKFSLDFDLSRVSGPVPSHLGAR